MRIKEISYPSGIDESHPDSDNIDVHVHLEDGRIYSFLVSTPKNVYWCMENEGLDFFYSFPPTVFVNQLTSDNIDRALRTLLAEDKKKWLALYGVLQADAHS